MNNQDEKEQYYVYKITTGGLATWTIFCNRFHRSKTKRFEKPNNCRLEKTGTHTCWSTMV